MRESDLNAAHRFLRLLAAAVWPLGRSNADVVYICHNKKGQAAIWVYHAPNLVLQLQNKAPRTGPLVAHLEMGDGNRLLLAIAKRLAEGKRYDMFRKLDSSGRVSFVAGDWQNGEVSSRRKKRRHLGLQLTNSLPHAGSREGHRGFGDAQRFTLHASDVAAAAAAGPSAAAGGSAAGDSREAARRRKLVIRDRCPWGHLGCCAYPSKALGWPARCIC